MSKTAIQWTEQTWNPVVGCSIVSPGCKNCYAMKEAWRFGFNQQLPRYHGLTGKVNGKAVWTGKLALAPEATLLEPLRRKKPTTYFVNSMGDLFHENCPDEWIDRVFAVMALSPQHTFQVLTKRAARMRDYCKHQAGVWCPQFGRRKPMFSNELIIDMGEGREGPLPNVWLGVSAERQQEADERIPLLLQTPAAVRFVSAEPLLGPLRLDRICDDVDTFKDCGGHPDPHWPIDTQDATWLNALLGRMEAEARNPAGEKLGDIDVGLRHEGGKINWVISGGESGPRARPSNPQWFRDLRDQCASAGTAFFHKQNGEWVSVSEVAGAGEHFSFPDGRTVRRVGKKAAGRLLDGVEHNAMPERTR